MSALDYAALDEYPLIARVLHEVEEVDSRLELLDRSLSSPIVPFKAPGARVDTALALVPVDGIPEGASPRAIIPLIEPSRMGELVPLVKELSQLDHPALALDLRPLADTAPFGAVSWRPRTREDLAELRAAASIPLWIVGVHSAADAEVAVEAGVDGVVVNSALGAHLGGPATVRVLPEILDAVAGMTGIYASGPVRTGIDIFRYLAVGADAVIVETDRSPGNLEVELHYAMRLTGCSTLADIGYESIYAPLFDEG